jgi:Nitrate reductase beta subunit
MPLQEDLLQLVLGQIGEMHLLLSAHRGRQPTVCSETCVGRIRYLGVILYDADRIQEAASVPDEGDLYEAQLKVFLDPFDPRVQAQARLDGISEAWLEAAEAVAGMEDGDGLEDRLSAASRIPDPADGLVRPALSPIQAAAAKGDLGVVGGMPDVKSLRIPVEYLANLLTAGRTEPVTLALERMLAMRAYMRAKTVDGVIVDSIAERVGLSGSDIEAMYQLMAIANYEDRFVIPTAHRETGEDAFQLRGSCGFSFGEGCSGKTGFSLFDAKKPKTPMEVS